MQVSSTIGKKLLKHVFAIDLHRRLFDHDEMDVGDTVCCGERGTENVRRELCQLGHSFQTDGKFLFNFVFSFFRNAAAKNDSL